MRVYISEMINFFKEVFCRFFADGYETPEGKKGLREYLDIFNSWLDGRK